MKIRHSTAMLFTLIVLVLASCYPPALAPAAPPAPASASRAVGDTNFTNVVTSGDVTVGDDLAVTGDAAVTGNLTVDGTLTATTWVTSSTSLDLSSTLAVDGAVTLGGETTINDNATVTGTLSFEGTADDYETTITATDPTADNAVTLPNSAGTLMLSTLATNAPEAANAVWGASNALVFEGATGGGNAFETSITPADPTADNTVTLANASGTVMLSSLATNAPGVANSVTGASNGLIFEGSTGGNNFETTVSATDPTADRSVVIPDGAGTVMLSTLATNAPDAANSVTGASNALVFEGATGGADANETSLVPTDPTADNTLTLPNMSGTVLLGSAANKLVLGSNTVTGTLTVTHGLTTPQYALCTMGADPTDNEEDRCTVAISGANVVVKVWKEAASPTAGDSGVTVYWMVAGQP